MSETTDINSAKAVSLPAPDCDLLYGVRAIARWHGLTYEQCRPLIDEGIIPTFRPPGKTVRCALKSALNETWQKYSKGRNSNGATTLHAQQCEGDVS